VWRGADVGAALVEDPHVQVISFTGSTTAGRAVGELAGRHLKRATWSWVGTLR
jgi:benzaldehyde dehydrogenase (NAD)